MTLYDVLASGSGKANLYLIKLHSDVINFGAQLLQCTVIGFEI